MGLLDKFERGLERVVNGAFAKTFRSGVEPVEIAAALRRELDTNARVVSRERILVPNLLTAHLSAEDSEELLSLGDTLIDELKQSLQKHAASNGYSFAAPLIIEIDTDEKLTKGMLEVTSRSAKGEVAWQAVIDIKGTRHRLRKGATIVGRGSDSDITIDDAGASRKHVEIIWDGDRAQVSDLGSTNGTKLNGKKLKKALLEPDSIIDIGATRLVYRVQAQTKGNA
ncbi:FhaA domain-containing protein [Agrococcus casei]|uniref:FhaA domain-containing protein n=1 Tax=Agrococcus casei TaxID=343512 RepID=UPI003F907B58